MPAKSQNSSTNSARTVAEFLDLPIDASASAFEIAEEITARMNTLEEQVRLLKRSNRLVCEQRDKAIEQLRENRQSTQSVKAMSR